MIHLKVELEAAPGTISGVVVPADGEPEPFFGWIDLAALLDRLRAAEGEPCEERER